MSLSSAVSPASLCGNCGTQRDVSNFRCANCGELLPAMLHIPNATTSSVRSSAHIASSSGAATAEINLFKRLFTSQGRLGRLQYLLANLILAGLQTLLGVVVLFPMLNSVTQALMEAQLNPEAAAAGLSFGPFIMSSLLIIGGSLFSLWSFCCLASQRSHDLGLPGTYCLFSLVPLLNIYWALRWWLSPGQVGANAYGPDPLG